MKSILLLGLVSCFAAADPLPPEIINAQVEGEGCSDKLTVRAATGAPISILFNNAALVVGKQANTGLARLRCRVVFSVLVPEDFQVRASAGAWSGSSFLPVNSKASASVTVRSFFEGESKSGVSGINLLSSATSESESIWSFVIEAPDAWTSCGKPANFTLLLNLVLRGDASEPEKVSLDPGSLELPSFLYKRCFIASE